MDGLDIDQTAALRKTQWPFLRDSLREGTYRPAPVRRVRIPKPGGGERMLGIPTVTDCLIQQAVLQGLQPILDPGFSPHSYGFRPGRSAHDAVLAAQRFVQSGRRIVVDVDLEKFFDRVDHDILIDRLRKKVSDPGIIRNVRSRRVGERVMALLRRLYNRLHLTVNEAKSAVASVFGRKFLGYAFWVAPKGVVKRRVADKAITAFKSRIRLLTHRVTGRSLEAVVARLRVFILGWKAYFRLAQTPGVWRELDKWIRHRIRAIQLKQWKRGKTVFRELTALGASPVDAQRVAANCRRWWRNSGMLLNAVLTIKWADQLGLPRLA